MVHARLEPFDSVTWTGHVDYDLNRWLTVSRLVKKPFSLNLVPRDIRETPQGDGRLMDDPGKG